MRSIFFLCLSLLATLAALSACGGSAAPCQTGTCPAPSTHTFQICGSGTLTYAYGNDTCQLDTAHPSNVSSAACVEAIAEYCGTSAAGGGSGGGSAGGTAGGSGGGIAGGAGGGSAGGSGGGSAGGSGGGSAGGSGGGSAGGSGGGHAGGSGGGTAYFSISGKVSGTGYRSVTVTLSSSTSAATLQSGVDGSGNYAFHSIPNNNSYVITPFGTNETFTPASRTISNFSADVGGQDFITARQKLIFVTSAAYDGNLKSQGAGSTGLAGADNLCATAAAAAVLGGTWRAWISDGTTAAIDRIQDVGPWVSVAGDGVVFNNKANLATNPLLEIRYDENGVAQSAVNVWTGTRTGGHASSPVYDCTDWTSSSQSVPGIFGRNNFVDGNWTNYVGSASYINCNGTAHLYCIEQ